MMDIRYSAARFYDFNPEFPNDIPFYIARIPSPQASVLELGCGTGRVTLALIPHCRFLYGIDLSSAMISICRDKLQAAGIPASKAQVEVGDITHFDLDQSFDLIIAPFRVFQNLESDEAVEGLFRCLHRHLSPGGTCILNVFRPYLDRESLVKRWISPEEKFVWEAPVEGGRVACYDRRPRLDVEKLILYPELIYRRFSGDHLVEEVELKLVMRCYYPDMFEKLIEDHHFKILRRWGGYEGEEYGEGSELVIEFCEAKDV